jgi:hypothetical protein
MLPIFEWVQMAFASVASWKSLEEVLENKAEMAIKNIVRFMTETPPRCCALLLPHDK